MSDDSSSESRSWWQPGADWGIIVSLLVAALAIFAPYFLIEPVANLFMPMLPLSPNLEVAFTSAAITVLSAIIVALAFMAYGKTIRDVGLAKPTLLLVGKAVLGLAVYLVVSICVQLIARHYFGLNANEPQDLGYTDVTNFDLTAMFIVLVVLTPFAEELLFRGFVFQGLRRRLPFWATALGVSAIFAWIHGQWNVGLDVFVMSLVMCYLVEKTKSLWAAIFLHMFKNGMAFYLVYLYNGA